MRATPTKAKPLAIAATLRPSAPGKPAEPAPVRQGEPAKNVTVEPPVVNLFEEALKEMLDAEMQLESAMPILAICATSPHMVDMYVNVLGTTNLQIARLKDIFKMAGLGVNTKRNAAMEGFMKELALTIELTPINSILRDMELIFCTQKIAQHTIAAYNSLRNIAQLQGHKQAVALLQQSLDEKNEFNNKLADMVSDLQSAGSTTTDNSTSL